jgi:hypothetical protein
MKEALSLDVLDGGRRSVLKGKGNGGVAITPYAVLHT